MLTVRETETFAKWLARLRDAEARARIARRIDRFALGNPGDVRPIGGGLSERAGSAAIALLAGGDKRTQKRDIEKARQLSSTLAE